MRLFHGTDAVFTSFSLDYAAREVMHSNGNLGVWLSSTPELASRFGTRLLEVDAAFLRIYTMSVGELSGLNTQYRRACARGICMPSEDQYYRQYREEMIGRGFDAIALQEITGDVEMYICLVPQSLRITKVHIR
jgi:hypothetical protein